MSMDYSPLKLDGTRKLLCKKLDPLKQPQIHNNLKKRLCTRYNMYIIIMKPTRKTHYNICTTEYDMDLYVTYLDMTSLRDISHI